MLHASVTQCGKGGVRVTMKGVTAEHPVAIVLVSMRIVPELFGETRFSRITRNAEN